jgi:hypothetical protein
VRTAGAAIVDYVIVVVVVATVKIVGGGTIT